MSKGKVRVGIVGTGKFAAHHVHAWRTIDCVRLIGVHGAHPERLGAFAQRTGLTGYPHFESLAQAVDILDIVSVNDTHCDYALKALPYVKGFMIEKPLDVCYDKALAFIKRWSEQGQKTASVVSQLRFHPRYIEVKRMLETGKLGDVQMCRVCLFWPREESFFLKNGGWRNNYLQAGGGVLIQQGIHAIDILHGWFGEIAECKAHPLHPEVPDLPGELCSVSESNEHPESSVERQFWGQLTFRSGTRCQLYFSTLPAPFTLTEWNLFGSRGRLRWVNDTLIIGDDGMRSLIRNAWAFCQSRQTTHLLLERQFQDFIEAYSNNRQPTVTLQDGLQALQTVQALYERMSRHPRAPSSLAENQQTI